MRGVLILNMLLILLSCSGEKAEEEKLIRVAISANTQFALEKITKAFVDSTNIKVDLIRGSSGKLSAQISNGSPFHIFLAANMKYPQFLHAEGMTLDPPAVYAYGTLILWTNRDHDVSQGLQLLLDPSIKTLAIANDRSAPYGTAAIESLKSAGLLEQIQDKIIRGESISQVNQFVSTLSVDVGITSKSVVIAKMKNQGTFYEIPDSFHNPIQQGVVMLKHARDNNYQNSLQFYNFLFSNTARLIFSEFGYSLPENTEE